MAGKLSREIKASVHTNETVIPRKEADKLQGISVKVDVDVFEAIRGLKAIQREAKESTKALREFENIFDFSEGSVIKDILKTVPTYVLQRELETREGVTTYELGEYGSYVNMQLVSADGGKTEFIEGPAIITVNID